MIKTGIVLCAMSLAAAGALHAADVIAVEKLSKADLAKAVQAASDDTLIENLGQTKTKAEWRSDFQAKYKPPDPAKLKEIAAESQAKFDADAKALQDQQDKSVAEQNAQIDKEFDALSSQ